MEIVYVFDKNYIPYFITLPVIREKVYAVRIRKKWDFFSLERVYHKFMISYSLKLNSLNRKSNFKLKSIYLKMP